MLARIVENWLISAGERGYEVAFAQLLAAEQYRVLHAPVHHPFEHGKDLVAVAEGGELHAFQLKAGDIGLSELERIQGQLFALAVSAIDYPGVEPTRGPDRVFLVTTGRLTPPARDRLRSVNSANRSRGVPPIESVECDQLVGRFVAAHGQYVPRELHELDELLRLVLAVGDEPFPVRSHAALLWDTLGPKETKPSATEATRALASALLLTSYFTGPWQRRENNLAVAEAWLNAAFSTLRYAEEQDLPESAWLLPFELARDSARKHLAQLMNEAAEADDLVIPDIVDGFVYAARAAVVCGYAGAHLISERTLTETDQLEPLVKEILLREMEYVQVPGECAVPYLLATAAALEIIGELRSSARLVVDWARGLCLANAPESDHALPDPYHGLQEVLLSGFDADVEVNTENFAGYTYTLHVALDWLARRKARNVVESLWPAVTKVDFCETRVALPARLMGHEDPDAVHHSWQPAAPASWAELVKVASELEEDSLPSRLWQHAYMIPYLPLMYPYRLTREVAIALDHVATGRGTIRRPE